MTIHYRNTVTGKYIGGFGGDAKPGAGQNAVKCPAPPHGAAIWTDDGWTYTAPLTRDLTRAEFIGMLAGTELDVIWTDMQAALKGVTGKVAEASRASLAANLHAKFYNLTATLGLVAQFRTFAASINPDYAAMLTDDNITAAWEATVARSNGGTA